MRKTLGVAIGLMIAIAVISGIDWIEQSLFPLPTDLESADPATMAAIVADLPGAAKALIVGAWFLGAFCGAWLALRIVDRPWAGWSIAVLVVVVAIATILMLPHPLWMELSAVILPLAGGALAARLHRKPYPGEPLLG